MPQRRHFFSDLILCATSSSIYLSLKNHASPVTQMANVHWACRTTLGEMTVVWRRTLQSTIANATACFYITLTAKATEFQPNEGKTKLYASLASKHQFAQMLLKLRYRNLFMTMIIIILASVTIHKSVILFPVPPNRHKIVHFCVCLLHFLVNRWQYIIVPSIDGTRIYISIFTYFLRPW